MNSVSYFEIQANEPTSLVEFYGKVFGWKFRIVPNLPIEYYSIETDGIRGGLLKRPVRTPPNEYGTNAYTCSMEVENFDETAKLIEDNGGLVALPKFLIPKKCWQGYFIDPDNNTFGVFQVLNNEGSEL